MNLYGDTNWFAIHAKRFRESLAAASVRALGIEAFLPMIKVDPLAQSPIKVTSKPLFPCYFFARFNPTTDLDAIESARGVMQVVRFGEIPVAVDENVIGEIRERVDTDGFIRMRAHELRRGDRVSIQAGPFEGMLGRVAEEPDDRIRVAILLEALWQARVLIDRRLVQAEVA